MFRAGPAVSACLTVTVLLGAAGCSKASRPVPTAAARAAVTARPASRPAGPAALALDEIQPRPVLPRPATRPSTKPAKPPPIEALVLYARARGELQENRRQSAIDLLEKAVALDPGSYELHYTLGRAYRGGLTYEPRSIIAMEKAAAIEPDHLEVHGDLARQYLARGDHQKGMQRLRLATQTTDYRENVPRAAEVDLFLATSLQSQGYDRAALQVYERLLGRLSQESLSRRANVELAVQISGKLYVQVGDLYLRQGKAREALAAYEKAAALAASNGGIGAAVASAGGADEFEVQARIARTLLAMGRRDEAAARAAAAVTRFRASGDSLALLRDVYRALGRENGAAEELARLHARRPNDRAILFALAEVLRTDGRSREADKLLERASNTSPGDVEVVRRRFAIAESEGDLRGAAKLLVEATARDAELAPQVRGLWARLLRPQNRRKLTLADLQSLDVTPRAAAARAHAVWRAAAAWPRRTLARSTLSQALAEAANARPVFAPTFRDRIAEVWDDDSLTARARRRLSDELIDLAQKNDARALAAELKGRAQLERGDAAAAASLAEAVNLAGEAGRRSPSLQLAFAAALRAFGEDARYERLLSGLVSDHPHFSPAHAALHAFHWSRGSLAQAEKTLAAWRDADPGGLEVRMLQVRDHIRLSRFDAAESLLNDLFEEFPDDSAVLAGLQALYAQTGRGGQFARKLEERRNREPRAFNLAMRLALAYTASGSLADAARVLDAIRAEAAAAREPDVLYSLSHLYDRAGQRPPAEDVLQQVLRIDPAHPGANNDLGYGWAEQGKNLAQAEALTRAAVEAEPDNPSLLDSLAWVLYKRGRFEEARQLLERALAGDDPSPEVDTANADEADPVVLDHLGDVMYRLNDRDAAGRLWERSQKRLGAPDLASSTRDDLKPLRLQLQNKRRQFKAGDPVSVAPVVELADQPAPRQETRFPSTRAGPAGGGQ